MVRQLVGRRRLERFLTWVNWVLKKRSHEHEFMVAIVTLVLYIPNFVRTKFSEPSTVWWCFLHINVSKDIHIWSPISTPRPRSWEPIYANLHGFTMKTLKSSLKTHILMDRFQQSLFFVRIDMFFLFFTAFLKFFSPDVLVFQDW